MSLLNQIKTNLIAIISLVVAITALFYTAWREEQTEKNRTLRAASFELLKNLGELQLIVNYAHYQSNDIMGNPILGWGHVAIISDMGEILPSSVALSVNHLAETWAVNWEKIKTDEASVEKISADIDASRKAALTTLNHLR